MSSSVEVMSVQQRYYIYNVVVYVCLCLFLCVNKGSLFLYIETEHGKRINRSAREGLKVRDAPFHGLD